MLQKPMLATPYFILSGFSERIMASMKILIAILTLGFMLSTVSEAKDILIGGKENSWAIPKSSKENLNHWAEKTRFTVGDFLIWKYDAKNDSVLEVTKEDYDSCKTEKPIEEHKDGNTKIELNRSGPYYFISGADGHCEKGQKLEIIVLSNQHDEGGSHGGDNSSEKVAPAPAPTRSDGGNGLCRGYVVLGLVMGVMGLVQILLVMV